MIKFLQSIWQLFVIKKEIRRQNFHKAERLILSRQRLGYKITLLEQIYLENRQLISQVSQIAQSSALSTGIEIPQAEPFFNIDSSFIDYINQAFKYTEYDLVKIQCTGIERQIFDEIECCLINFLEKEINKINGDEEDKKSELVKAFDDLNNLKRGVDPSYNLILSPHVYLMQYFLDTYIPQVDR